MTDVLPLNTAGFVYTNDLNTGMYRTGADAQAIKCGGTDVLTATITGIAIPGTLAVAGIVSGLGTTPIGAGMDYWGTTAPAGWLFPYGQVVSQTTYAALFAVLSTTYNTGGEGAGNFRLPDKRDKSSIGKGNMGGVSAGLITTAVSGFDGDTLGANGGAQSVTLDITMIPSHNHGGVTTGQSADHTHNSSIYGALGTTASGGNFPNTWISGAGAPSAATSGTSNDHTHGINLQGGGLAHRNMPPGIVCNYIIFAGV